jgi:hypothetical protein
MLVAVLTSIQEASGEALLSSNLGSRGVKSERPLAGQLYPPTSDYPFSNQRFKPLCMCLCVCLCMRCVVTERMDNSGGGFGGCGGGRTS